MIRRRLASADCVSDAGIQRGAEDVNCCQVDLFDCVCLGRIDADSLSTLMSPFGPREYDVAMIAIRRTG